MNCKDVFSHLLCDMCKMGKYLVIFFKKFTNVTMNYCFKSGI